MVMQQTKASNDASTDPYEWVMRIGSSTHVFWLFIGYTLSNGDFLLGRTAQTKQ